MILKTSKFEEYVKIRMAKLENKLKELEEDEVEIVECPKCHQVTFPLNEDLKCLFVNIMIPQNKLPRIIWKRFWEFQSLLQ